jgi:uncharacterized protein YqjF (DUF2071 family)
MNAPVPLPGVFLRAAWRNLVMMNFAIDADVLTPHVPRGTELDRFHDQCFVSLVGFEFRDVRVLGCSLPGHRTFDEVNLRFYVRRGERRGVVFLREIAPRWLVSFVARRLYNEEYITLPVRHQQTPPQGQLPGSMRYEWRYRGAVHHISAQVVGEPRLPEPGSEAEFIVEHYWGYSRQRDGSTMEYRVEHMPWRVWHAAAPSLAFDAEALYGPILAPYLRQLPTSVFVAEGSPVMVRRGVVLEDVPSPGIRRSPSPA